MLDVLHQVHYNCKSAASADTAGSDHTCSTNSMASFNLKFKHASESILYWIDRTLTDQYKLYAVSLNPTYLVAAFCGVGDGCAHSRCDGRWGKCEKLQSDDQTQNK